MSRLAVNIALNVLRKKDCGAVLGCRLRGSNDADLADPADMILCLWKRNLHPFGLHGDMGIGL